MRAYRLQTSIQRNLVALWDDDRRMQKNNADRVRDTANLLLTLGIKSATLAATLAHMLVNAATFATGQANLKIQRLALKDVHERELFAIYESLGMSSGATYDSNHELAYMFIRRILCLSPGEAKQQMMATVASRWAVTSRRAETIRTFASFEDNVCSRNLELAFGCSTVKQLNPPKDMKATGPSSSRH